MADMTFNTTAGQTIDRDLLVAYLNTGTSSSPVWSALGKRVSDSSIEYDWSKETNQDILGNTYTTLKKPTITQTFDSYPLDGGDTAVLKIWNLVKDQDAAALAALDLLIVHAYAGTANTAVYAERYDACAVEASSFGGEGGGDITTTLDVTYGGTRTQGTASISGGTVTFTAA